MIARQVATAVHVWLKPHLKHIISFNTLEEVVAVALTSAEAGSIDRRNTLRLRKALVELIEHFERVDAPQRDKDAVMKAWEVYVGTISDTATAQAIWDDLDAWGQRQPAASRSRGEGG